MDYPLIQPYSSSITSYRFISEIGSGKYGYVWSAIDEYNRPVAIKFVKLSSRWGYNTIAGELFPVSLDHPNIIKYHTIISNVTCVDRTLRVRDDPPPASTVAKGNFDTHNPEVLRKIYKLTIPDGRYIAIVMEQLEGDLLGICMEVKSDRESRGPTGVKDNIRRSHSLEMRKYFKSIAVQLVEAVCHITSHDLIHGDIKLENVLYRRVTDGYHVVLTDFSIATNNESQQLMRSSDMYTLPYRSPEIAFNSKGTALYNGRSDVWALACLLYEIYTGHQLFAASDVIELRFQMLCRCELPVFDNPMDDFIDPHLNKYVIPATRPMVNMLYNVDDEGLVNLLSGMLKVNPAERMTIFEVRTHPYFVGMGEIPKFSPPRLRFKQHSHPFVINCEELCVLTDEVIATLNTWMLTVAIEQKALVDEYIDSLHFLYHYLSLNMPSKRELQLYASASLALKLDVIPASGNMLDYLSYLSGFSFMSNELLRVQTEMLRAIKYDVLSSSPLDEIQSHSDSDSDAKTVEMASLILKFVASTPHYFERTDMFIRYRRSLPMDCITLAKFGLDILTADAIDFDQSKRICDILKILSTRSFLKRWSIELRKCPKLYAILMCYYELE